MATRNAFIKISVFMAALVALFAVAGISKVFADSINLIQNPELAADPSNTAMPLNWRFGFNGNNNAVGAYPASGPGEGIVGAQITISSYTDGFADWFSNSISVTPLAEYHYSDSYLSDTTGIIEAVYSVVDGVTGTSTVYTDLAYLSATNGSWANADVTFTIPAGAVSLTIFHLINNAGSLTIANPSLTATNPIVNPPVNTPPTVTLIGANPFSITIGNTFTDPGATATDTEDGDLTSAITSISTVNTTIVGTYEVVYSVTDNGGLSASTTRTVIVSPAVIPAANLIPNPTFDPDPSNLAVPKDWKFSTYGTNIATGEYPAPGPDADTNRIENCHKFIYRWFC